MLVGISGAGKSTWAASLAQRVTAAGKRKEPTSRNNAATAAAAATGSPLAQQRAALPLATEDELVATLAALPELRVVSSDDIRRRVAGRVDAFHRDQEVFAALHRDVHDALRRGHGVVVDATNLLAASRAAFAGGLPASCRRFAKVFDCSVAEARRRIDRDVAAGADRTATPTDVLRRQDNQLGFDPAGALRAEGWTLIA